MEIFRIEKQFTRGTFKGLVSVETMNFVSLQAALDWASAVTKKEEVPYNIISVERI